MNNLLMVFGGVGDTKGVGGDGDKQAGTINTYLLIYITSCLPVV